MRTTPKMWLGVLAVFTCGLVIGAVAGDIFAHHQLINRMAQINETRGGVLVDSTLKRLTDNLDLNQAQEDEIRPLLTKTFRQIHQIHEQSEVGMIAVMKSTAGLIAKQLSPGQREKMKQARGYRLLLPESLNEE